MAGVLPVPHRLLRWLLPPLLCPLLELLALLCPRPAAVCRRPGAAGGPAGQRHHRDGCKGRRECGRGDHPDEGGQGACCGLLSCSTYAALAQARWVAKQCMQMLWVCGDASYCGRPANCWRHHHASIPPLAPPSLQALALRPLQEVWLMVPSISRFQWHPFSVAGGSADGVLTLHVKRYGPFTKVRGQAGWLHHYFEKLRPAGSWTLPPAVSTG